jgi:hypothetical protein
MSDNMSAREDRYDHMRTWHGLALRRRRSLREARVATGVTAEGGATEWTPSLKSSVHCGLQARHCFLVRPMSHAATK